MFEFPNSEKLASRNEGDITFAILFTSLRLCVFTPLAMLGLVTASSLSAEDDDEKPVVAGRQIYQSDQSFDQNVFGASVANRVVIENGVQRVVRDASLESAASMARKRMESAIEAELKWIEAGCRLTDIQKKKLRLAGRGDIANIFNRAEELRTKVVGRSLNQQEYSELSMEMSQLRMASLNGLLNDASLFRKTLRRTLDDEQRAGYLRLLRQRQLVAAESGLTVWDRVANNNPRVNANKDNGMKLSPETRRKVCGLVVEQGRLPETASSYMNYIVLLEADRIAEQIRPLMDDEQWDEFQKLVVQAKRVEPSIRRYAQWPPTPADDDNEAKDGR